jgi:hypothetical protein
MRRDGGVADAARAAFAFLLAFSLAMQAQLSGTHFHFAANGSIQSSNSLPDSGSKNHDPKSDNQCLLCQQLASAHNYLFNAAPAAPDFDLVAETVLRVPVTALRTLRQSFNWLSRAPPVA